MTRKIGRYEILGPLATGGMAEILLARLVGPSGFERPVVIKRIRPDLDHVELTSLFLEEARLAARVRHANVVAVEDLGTDEGVPYLVMEYLEGESLSNVSRRLVTREEKLPAGLAAYVIAEACAGLHAAHELRDTEGRLVGLVHRDVSPQNVFVTYDGAIKVVDFGIARTDDSELTEPGEIRGKFGYIAPEQLKHEPLDRRSDIFALGIVLHELLTGHRLFKRFSHAANIRAILTDLIVAPSRIEPTVPPELDAVCKRALNRAPDERYATASEMRRELLVAMRSLTSEEPSAELAELMSRAFPDRIGDKRELVRNVREGSVVDRVPAGDVDVTIEIPGLPLFDDAAAPAPLPSPTAPPSPAPTAPSAPLQITRPRRRGWLLAMLLLGALALGVAIRFGVRARAQAQGSAQAPQPPASSSSPPIAIAESPPTAVSSSASPAAASESPAGLASVGPGTAAPRTEPRQPVSRKNRGPSAAPTATSAAPTSPLPAATEAATPPTAASPASARGFRRFQ